MSIFEVNAEKDHIDMKKHLVFILSAIQTLNAVAGHITRDEALALAQDFMQGKVMVPVQTSSSKAPVRDRSIHLPELHQARHVDDQLRRDVDRPQCVRQDGPEDSVRRRRKRQSRQGAVHGFGP